MRVLQVMAGARHGGAEAFFCRLVPALARAGVEQRAVIRSHPERAADLRAAGVATLELGFKGRFDFATRWRLRTEIRRFQPHVVLSWMNRATLYCPSRHPRQRPQGIERAGAPAKTASRYPGRLPGYVHIGRLGGYYDLKYYRRCDRLIANTRDLLRYVSEHGFPADRAHYLPNFAAEVHADPLPRRALDTPEDARVMLAMGRLHHNKAFDVLLRALAEVPEATLWLAGEGPERHGLEALAASLGIAGRVRFLGWREDGPALLRSADVFACPSRHEPLGNVVLEAWCQGVPVVAAASQGPRSLIRDQVDGLLAPVDDPPALAGALRRLLNDSAYASRLGAAGRAAYQAEYTETQVVRRYLDLFAMATGGA